MEQIETDKRKFKDLVIGVYYFQLKITGNTIHYVY